MKHPLLKTTIALLAIILALPAAAQDSLFDTGAISFEYAQYPVGPYSGVFSAEGAIDPDDPGFPDGAQACYGVVTALAETHYLLCVGGVLNPDQSVDAALLFITSSAAIVPGTYGVDPLHFSANFAFLDDAVGVSFPDDPCEFDWDEWLSLIDAAHLFVGVSGEILIESIDMEQVVGAFTGLMAEEGGDGMLIEISAGLFEIGRAIVPAESSSWGEIKALYR